MSTNSAAQLSLEAPEDSVHHESVAIFVTKLWGILSKPDYSHLISWSEVSSSIAFISQVYESTSMKNWTF